MITLTTKSSPLTDEQLDECADFLVDSFNDCTDKIQQHFGLKICSEADVLKLKKEVLRRLQEQPELK